MNLSLIKKIGALLFVKMSVPFFILAMDFFGQPTRPIPFDNDLEKRMCALNSVLQCFLRCPKFCSFIDQIEKPKNKLELDFKNLREGLRQFKCDSDEFFYFVNKPFSYHNRLSVLKKIISCSAAACLGIRESAKNDSIIEVAYDIAKNLFGLANIEYGNQIVKNFKQLPSNCLSIPQILFFYIPAVDIFLVCCAYQDKAPLDVELYSSDLCKMTESFQSFVKEHLGKQYNLMAVSFAIKRCLAFKNECPTVDMVRNGDAGKLHEGFSVWEEECDFFGHCAAYVNCENIWCLCDDLYRMCLDRELIRQVDGGLKEMFVDLVQKEHGDAVLLFFN